MSTAQPESRSSSPQPPEHGYGHKMSNSSLEVPASATAKDVIVPPSGQTARQATEAQIVVAPQPLKIDIDTPTDWPAVLAPFVLGAAAFYFTSSNQSQQIRSSTANYRNEWLREVRESAIEFVSAAFEFHMRNVTTEDFVDKHTDEARVLVTRMLKAQATIVLMLDAKQPYTKEIDELMDTVVAHINSGAPDAENIASEALQGFIEKTHQVLEKAWQDIRKDLGHNQGLLRRIWTKIRS